MSRCASYEDAHDPKYGEAFPVPIVMATADALKRYGTIVTDFENEEVEITPWPVKGWRRLCPGTGTLGGLINDELTYKWVGDQSMVTDDTEDGDFITDRLPKSISPLDRTHVLVRKANYHPDGGQVFLGMI